MNKILVKTRNYYTENANMLLLAGVMFFWASLTFAAITKATGNNDAAFANAYYWLDSVMHGYLGILLAAVAFVVCLIIAIAKQSPMAVVGGIVFALIIAFGLDMVVGIVNTSLIKAMIII